MTAKLKNKTVLMLVTAFVIGGMFALVTHHLVFTPESSHHEDCDTFCKIACFTQAASNVAAKPENLKPFSFLLPILVGVVFISIYQGYIYNKKELFCCGSGPPIYSKNQAYLI